MPEYKRFKQQKPTDFRAWLTENGKTESECWVALKRGKPKRKTVRFTTQTR